MEVWNYGQLLDRVQLIRQTYVEISSTSGNSDVSNTKVNNRQWPMSQYIGSSGYQQILESINLESGCCLNDTAILRCKQPACPPISVMVDQLNSSCARHRFLIEGRLTTDVSPPSEICKQCLEAGSGSKKSVAARSRDQQTVDSYQRLEAPSDQELSEADSPRVLDLYK
ncbi:hypothetical protein J6590_059144 [Homalodisca vitripennis]|nr:hypothetical protein J6590_059144 [Homalodisca vitripennis]